MIRSGLCAACIFLYSLSSLQAQNENLSVLTGWNVHNVRWIQQVQAPYSALSRLNARAFRAIDRRDREVTLAKTAEDWQRRREEVRRTIDNLLGPWPGKTPLNAQIVKVIQRDGFRVETLMFESLPGFHVPAALYIPDRLSTPAPGILYIPGHTQNGFRADHYQKFCLNLVHKGFVVLAYDPIDQGERLQNIDPETGEPFVSRRTLKSFKIHSYPGNQCYLSGVSIARYFIWDAIRGIDYLVSRPEVDGNRIGVTGNSGGGNLTVFTGAVDDRVTAAVPSCWVTSYRRMIELNGLQDAEQNIFNGLTRGLEHAEWLLARAPKPTMLMTTTRDFFPMQGARETETEARRAWTALGAPDNLVRVEDDNDHGYTKKNSEAAYAFLMQHLGLSGDPGERDYPLFTEEELQVTTTGQVATALNGETVQSLNRTGTQTLLRKLERMRKRSDHSVRTMAAARRLSGYESPRDPGNAVYRGGYPRSGYRVDKYGLTGPDGSVVPVLLFVPDEPGPHPAMIYAHPEGKSADAATAGLLESLVQRDMIVAAVDVANTGETALPFGRQNDYDMLFYTGLMAGGSVVGLQAADLVRTVNWLQTREEIVPDRIGLMAVGRIGPSALHAAAFEPDVQWMALVESPVSYTSMVMNRRYDFTSDCMVAGALTAYDLPDLLACFAPKKIALIGPVDQEKQPLTVQAANEELQYPLSLPDSKAIRIVTGNTVSIADITTWCSDAAK